MEEERKESKESRADEDMSEEGEGHDSAIRAPPSVPDKGRPEFTLDQNRHAFLAVLGFCFAKVEREKRSMEAIPREELTFVDSHPDDARYLKLFYNGNLDGANPSSNDSDNNKFSGLFAFFDSDKFDADLRRLFGDPNPIPPAAVATTTTIPTTTTKKPSVKRRGPIGFVRPSELASSFSPLDVESVMGNLISSVKRMNIGAAPTDFNAEEGGEGEGEEIGEGHNKPMDEKFDDYVTRLNAIPLLMPISTVYSFLTRSKRKIPLGEGGGSSKEGLESAYVSSIYTVCSLKALFYADLVRRKSNLHDLRRRLLGREGEEKEGEGAPGGGGDGTTRDIEGIKIETKFLQIVENRLKEDLNHVMETYQTTVGRILGLLGSYMDVLLERCQAAVTAIKPTGGLNGAIWPVGAPEERYAVSRFNYIRQLYERSNYSLWVGLIRAHERACLNMFLYHYAATPSYCKGSTVEDVAASCVEEEEEWDVDLTGLCISRAASDPDGKLGLRNPWLDRMLYCDFLETAAAKAPDALNASYVKYAKVDIKPTQELGAVTVVAKVDSAFFPHAPPSPADGLDGWSTAAEWWKREHPVFRSGISSYGFGVYLTPQQRKEALRLKIDGLDRLQADCDADPQFRSFCKGTFPSGGNDFYMKVSLCNSVLERCIGHLPHAFSRGSLGEDGKLVEKLVYHVHPYVAKGYLLLRYMQEAYGDFLLK